MRDMQLLLDLIDLRQAVQRFLEALSLTKKEREVAPIVKELEKALGKAWRRQGALFLKALEDWRWDFPEEQQEALREAIDYWEWWPLLRGAYSKTNSLFVNPIDRAVVEAYMMGSEAQIADMAIEYAFNLRNPRAEAYIREYGARLIRGIEETTRSEIHSILERSSREGWSYDKTARAISDRFEEFAVGRPQEHIRSRAHLVAVTETGNAYEEGNLEAARQIDEFGLPMEKLWVNVGDDRVSDGCLANTAEGWIPINQAL